MSIPRNQKRATSSDRLTDPTPVPAPPVAMGARRTAVLDRLRGAAEPTTAAAVAEQTGLHLNTARFHLDGLVEQGRAERRTEERGTPGRPRVLYTAVAPITPTAEPRSYQLLSRMLAGLVASLDQGESAATEAGRAWGSHLVAGAAPNERVDAEAALERLDSLMDRIGFAPETRPGGEAEVHLHHCPFREVAVENPDVVCSMHLGLMQGALGELGAPVAVESLRPFATPDACVARLRLAPEECTTQG
ncbi:MAG TPA: helix-turn-helix domain-containing protein [Marmoricola sp.]|nr:helix-turn-helix domain-containing protein [Marmoricola sp.]